MEARKAKATCLFKNLRLPLGNIFLGSCSLGLQTFYAKGTELLQFTELKSFIF